MVSWDASVFDGEGACGGLGSGSDVEFLGEFADIGAGAAELFGDEVVGELFMVVEVVELFDGDLGGARHGRHCITLGIG